MTLLQTVLLYTYLLPAILVLLYCIFFMPKDFPLKESFQAALMPIINIPMAMAAMCVMCCFVVSVMVKGLVAVYNSLC